jgi:hypothetical protein
LRQQLARNRPRAVLIGALLAAPIESAKLFRPFIVLEAPTFAHGCPREAAASQKFEAHGTYSQARPLRRGGRGRLRRAGPPKRPNDPAPSGRHRFLPTVHCSTESVMQHEPSSTLAVQRHTPATEAGRGARSGSRRRPDFDQKGSPCTDEPRWHVQHEFEIGVRLETELPRLARG